MNHFHAEILRKRMHHLFGLVQAQQPVVHEDAHQPIANGAMNQGRRDRRINAAGQPEQHIFACGLRAHGGDCFAEVVVHVPVVAATANVVREAGENRRTLFGMRHFRMKLHRVEPSRLVSHRRNGSRNPTSRST